ncbi:hypothetical protein GZH47_25015 [Paenibacillus rhizovicinus]|uniref:SLH domain-containing protein n=1 Tax=Paenibacillus rhizovicinus TaxID=2704463 RepID=A0A6C0P5H2_9BACL|nr:S-layer homology domain-containing protein [Paenibacillus rhizovicinus]QHW33737.1 hypothetical protein GZH47_25015 [Paenibacillus rhizovicinus]
MSMKRTILPICMALLLCVSCLLPHAALADGAPSFSLAVTGGTLKTGSEFKVTLTGNDVADLFANEVRLTYDSAKLQFKGAVGAGKGYDIEPIVQDNAITLAHTMVGAIPGVSGTATLYTLTFKAIAAGKTAVVFQHIKTVNSKLESVEIDVNANLSVDIAAADNPPAGGGGNGSDNGGGNGNGNGNGNNNGNSGGDDGKLQPDSGTESANNSHTAMFSLGTDKWASELQNAKEDEDGNRVVRVDLADVPDAQAYALKLPPSFFTDGTGKVRIEIVTPFGRVTLRTDMFPAGSLPQGEITISIGKADAGKLNLTDAANHTIAGHPVIELQLLADGKNIAWSNLDAPVAVSIPYTPSAAELNDPEHLTVRYVDGSGNAVPVYDGRYNETQGSMTFTTTHFSTYAVAFVNKTFNDLGTVDWARKQIEVLAAKGIVNGVSEQQFAPSRQVTRAEFITMLMRTLGLDTKADKNADTQFADAVPGSFYDDALSAAKALGIAKGIDGARFYPSKKITRQDMMVMTARALEAAGILDRSDRQADLNGFSDRASIASYAADDIASLVSKGLVAGSGGMIRPLANTTRAETAVLMYRIYGLS